MNTNVDADIFPGSVQLTDTEFQEESRLRRVWTFVKGQSNRVILLAGVLLFLLVFLWPSIFVTINSGEVGVMYRRFGGGTVTDRLLGEGIRFVPPWDKLFVYNVRLQEVHHTMSALTQEGLEIKVNLSIRYRPEMELVGLLHQRVGPDYPTKVVVPEVESALRIILGSQRLDDIYRAASPVVERVVNESLEQVSRNYVHVDEVLVLAIELPKAVAEKIEAKVIEKETADTYQYRLRVAEGEAERKRIEAGGIATYNSLVNASVTPNVLQWEALQATKELAKSPNAKTVVIGRNSDGLPIILPQQ